jgi:hypothetical protein
VVRELRSVARVILTVFRAAASRITPVGQIA